MRPIQAVGLYADVIEAPSPEDQRSTIRIGIRYETLRPYARLKYYTPIAQYYGIVQGSLHLARHLYRGLMRPLMLADDTKADENVLIYTWRSEVDFEWVGSPFGGNPEQRIPPSNRVFVVIVRQQPSDEHGVTGSIERWNWIKEDQHRRHAPVEWEKRYRANIWSREI